MAVRYLNRVQARKQDPDAVGRGAQAGEIVSKALSGLGAAISAAKKDALANKLMTDQSISEQPGAGQTVSLGKLPGGPQPNVGEGGGDDPNDLGLDVPAGFSKSRYDPDPDPIANPAPAGINPDYEPYSFTDRSDLNKAVAQRKVASSLPPSGGDDWSLSGFGGGSGKGTVGGLLHTGGVQEMELRKEMAAQNYTSQMNQMNLAKARREAILAQQEDAGTGRFALDAALKRAQLAAAQAKVTGPASKPADLEKNPPPAENLDTEPVLNQAQLEKTVDEQYGKGAYGGLTRTINEPETIDDPKGTIDPTTGKVAQIPNPNGPQITGENKDSITLGPKAKRITMTLTQAQILAKQHNSVNFKKGLPLIRVPGEDQTQGTKENPYPIKTKLDMLSRAHGTWVRLPGGQVAQVP